MSRSAVVVAPQRWRAYVPGLAVVTSYQRSWLPKDIVAGLVLSALLVPQGMAYADLAGLPAVTGLYTSILCLLAYAVFGPSRVLVLGPDSSLGPMIAATILPRAHRRDSRSCVRPGGGSRQPHRGRGRGRLARRDPAPHPAAAQAAECPHRRRAGRCRRQRPEP